MGMYDNLRCEFPLPAPNAQNLDFQTKDTPAQWLDNYVIRADGSLWHETYEIVDRSDPNAEGLLRLVGCMSRDLKAWERVSDFTGEICFYEYPGEGQWLEFSAYFKDGALQQLNLITDTRRVAAAALEQESGQ